MLEKKSTGVIYMIKRKLNWKGGIAAIIAATMCFSTPSVAKADVYWPEGPEISSQSGYVIEVNSGAVLYNKNGDEVKYPASITKVMTTLLVLEHCDLEEVVTFSDDAINYNQGDTSHIARDYGEKMTIKECLYAVMLESANECAYAVAEHVGEKLGGDYQTFIDLMNERAKELGCTNTHFANANGLPDENHWTSAHDMALISAEAYKNEVYRIMVGSKNYRIPPTNKHKDITYLNNHHMMITTAFSNQHLYEYCTGGKTGYTQAAGATLVSYAEKDGLVLACVVMKTTGQNHYVDTRTLFDYCFQNFQQVELGDNGSVGENLEDSMGNGLNYEPFVKLDENAQIVLPITADISDVEMSLVNEDLTGDAIAKLQYTYGGHVAGSVAVVPSNVEVEDKYFGDQPAPEDKNVIVIKTTHILIALAILVGIIVAILAGKLLYDNYYLIRHDLKVKQQRRERFRPVSERKKKWRKKDRMFK